MITVGYGCTASASHVASRLHTAIDSISPVNPLKIKACSLAYVVRGINEAV